MQSIEIVLPPEIQNEMSEIRKELSELRKSFQPKEPTVYLTRQEVAEILHVDLTTIWSYTKKGILISYGIGSRVFYKRHEVESSLVRLRK